MAPTRQKTDDVALRFAAPQKKAPSRPLADRGRMLYVRDIQEMFGKKPDGSYVKGIWWVRNSFAPEYRQKLGRDTYWWECDVQRWLDRESAA